MSCVALSADHVGGLSARKFLNKAARPIHAERMAAALSCRPEHSGDHRGCVATPVSQVARRVDRCAFTDLSYPALAVLVGRATAR